MKNQFEYNKIINTIDYLLATINECILDSNYKKHLDEFNTLQGLIQQLKISFIQKQTLTDINNNVMENIFNIGDKLFDIYLIDEIDYNVCELRQYYQTQKKRKIIEELRRKNREKRKNE